MTATEYERASEYRSQMMRALEFSKRNLPRAHFDVTAEGLRAEILRLTEELERHRLEAFLRQSFCFQNLWTFIDVEQRTLVSVRPRATVTFNSTEEATPWSSCISAIWTPRKDQQYPTGPTADVSLSEFSCGTKNPIPVVQHWLGVVS